MPHTLTIDQSSLARLDARGYTTIEALTDAGLGQSPTHARPNAFVCIDGKTYWVKGRAQQGLVAELIAGRLAAELDAGPMARVIRVTVEVLPHGGTADHLQGVVAGLEDLPGTVNGRDLAPFIANGRFQPGLVEPASRARVVVFQTWIGAGDSQVLVRLSDGTVFSIDHGDCFGSTAGQTDPTVVLTAIPGVPPEVGKEARYVSPAVEQIESITDGKLLEAVAGVPMGGEWRSPVERRVQIASWLAYRRGRLREVMRAWIRT